MTGSSLGMRIVEALTREQVIHLLDTVFRIQGNQGREKLLSALDDDVASTLSRLLNPGAVSQTRIVSDDKRLEEWRGLWQRWEQVVSELGDQDGRYAVRDHHWEEPYFSASDFADDLERVAEQMHPMLKSVHEIGDEEADLFEGALVDIENDIGAYPDWMGAQDAECTLGPQTTRCVLEWTWLGASSAGDFITQVAALQDRLTFLDLNADALLGFFGSLPEEDRRAVYEALDSRRNEPDWREDLESTKSTWHEVYHTFRETYDPEGYIEDCRRLLPQEWRYGFPVMEHLASVGQVAEAERVAEETMASLLKTSWRPEETLLSSVLKKGYYYRISAEQVSELLVHWTSFAEQLNQEERAAALRLHRVSWEDPSDWAGIAECYQALRRSSFSETAEQLVAQWKQHVLYEQLSGGYASPKLRADCWVMWLLDEAMCDVPDGERFLSKVDQWLQDLMETREGEIGDQRDFLSILTCDLMHFHEPAARYGRLRAVLCGGEGRREMSQIRRAWLQRVGAEQLTPFVIQCWQIHLPKLMPDPGQASSIYTLHAQWLAALNELDPSASRKIYLHWKDAYKRRRNLWKAIQEQGLSF